MPFSTAPSPAKYAPLVNVQSCIAGIGRHPEFDPSSKDPKPVGIKHPSENRGAEDVSRPPQPTTATNTPRVTGRNRANRGAARGEFKCWAPNQE